MPMPSFRSVVALVFLSLVACHRPGDATPRCKRLVDKVLECDPSSHGVPRETIERQCIDARLHCGDLDTTTPEGCTRFMGCLYDG